MATARFFRLLIHAAHAGSAASNYVRIGDIVVSDSPGGPTLCVAGSAFAQSSYYPAERAFDGGSAANSQDWAGNPSSPSTIGYDFGSAKTFVEVTITNSVTSSGAEQNQFIKTFDIQSSANGTDWTTLYSVTDHPNASGVSVSYSVATYLVEGLTTEEGAPVSRTVRLYRRDTGALLMSTTSDSESGAYSFESSYGGEVQVVCLDDSAGTTYNDLVARATPV